MLFSTPQDPVDSPILNWVLSFPDTVEFRQLILGALCALRDPQSWREVGMEIDPTIEHFAEVIRHIRLERISMSYVGAIEQCVTATAPAGRLLCDGSSYARVDYPDLYDALDTTYHVDANNFTVPDFRNRMAIGSGDDHVIGESGGSEEHTLTVSELPHHTHYRNTGQTPEFSMSNATDPTRTSGSTNTWAGGASKAYYDSQTGGIVPLSPNKPFPTMSPYHVVKFVIVAEA